MTPAVETGEILKEISARLREELDYELEARHTRLYGIIFATISASACRRSCPSCRPSGCSP